MSNYEDVYAPDLTEETESTLSGSEQFVMFDSVEGKRAELSTIADYIVANGEIDGSDIPTIVSTIEGSIGTLDTKVGDLTDLETTDKTSAVDAINEVLSKIPVMTKEVTGNPITVDDALGEVDSLTVDLEPVQDLHGYDKPWAAGAGKNKVNIASGSITATTNLLSKELSAGTHTFSAYGKRDDNGSWRVQIADQSDVAIAAGNEASGSTITQSKVTFTLTETATIRLKLQFLNSYDTLRYERLQLELGSTATTYEPYSNICPITGHDSVTVTDTGINQWDEEMELGHIDVDTGAYIDNTNNLRTKNKIPVFPSTSYYIALNKSVSGNIGVIYYDKDEQFISSEINPIKRAYTTPSGCRYMAFFVPVSWYGNTYTNDISVNLPSTDTAYHAYHGQSKTVTLPHTVYGGDVDVTAGAGTEKMANIASYNGETINEPWLSSMDEYSSGATPTTGAQVVYTLATPATLTTTPTDITLYNGDNVVSSDGNMDMVYMRDIVKVIEKLEG